MIFDQVLLNLNTSTVFAVLICRKPCSIAMFLPGNHFERPFYKHNKQTNKTNLH